MEIAQKVIGNIIGGKKPKLITDKITKDRKCSSCSSKACKGCVCNYCKRKSCHGCKHY